MDNSPRISSSNHTIESMDSSPPVSPINSQTKDIPQSTNDDEYWSLYAKAEKEGVSNKNLCYTFPFLFLFRFHVIYVIDLFIYFFWKH